MKRFNGKAIYQPSGKAGEYAEYACNFYNGCSNGCEYCYCKKGILAHTMGGDTPTLKKCFRSEEHALEVFKKELATNLSELQKHGLFFSFTTDPMLPETIDLTFDAIGHAQYNVVPCKILTKCAGWVDDFLEITDKSTAHLWAFGFTLTGHDELEPNASTNAERIDAMRKLHEAGFKTFASIEPIVDFDSSAKMIEEAEPYCDLFKIGLMSGRKYDEYECRRFVSHFAHHSTLSPFGYKIYFKDSIMKAAGFDRSVFGVRKNIVGSDYNIFK